jgi:hypothetical protein
LMARMQFVKHQSLHQSGALTPMVARAISN